MTTETAEPAKLTVEELIDRKQELQEQIDKLATVMDDLDHQIKCGLLESGRKDAYGSNGIGFRLTSRTSYEYKQPAYDYLRDKGLLEVFLAAPKITKGKLEALQKEGQLTYADLAEIEKWTLVDQSPYTLARVVPKEARVF